MQVAKIQNQPNFQGVNFKNFSYWVDNSKTTFDAFLGSKDFRKLSNLYNLSVEYSKKNVKNKTTGLKELQENIAIKVYKIGNSIANLFPVAKFKLNKDAPIFANDKASKSFAEKVRNLKFDDIKSNFLAKK